MRVLSDGTISLQKWLGRRRAAAVALNGFSSFALLVAAVTVLAGTFFFTYAVVWVGYNLGLSALSELIFNRHLHIAHRGILVICWCFLLLLFLENARRSRDPWTSYTVSRSQWSNLWAGLVGSLVALLVNAKGSTAMITDLLLSGPRLIGAFAGSVRKAPLLISADLQTCADALTILAGATSSLTAETLRARMGDRDSSRLLDQLAALGAVLFLRREPPSIVLDPDFRDQIRDFVEDRSAEESHEDAQPEPATTASTDSLYELLGVPASASLEEVRAAYRRKMKMWHPDVFAGRTEESRREAEEKTKAIIAAYEGLLNRHRGKKREKTARYEETEWNTSE
jgi:hypothetical protein